MKVAEGDFLPDSDVLTRLITLFERTKPDSRERLFQTLSTYLGFAQSHKVDGKPNEGYNHEKGGALARFTEDRSLSAKEFLLQKQPRSDAERVACLAYYLTHYLDRPHFKTIDISRLNTEAAQIKFSNPAFSVVNATNSGYLTQAGKGFKQISAFGEQYVAALPERDAAKAVMNNLHRRRTGKKLRRAATNSE